MDSSTQKKALPRRVRFYHSKIDGRNLKSGDDYGRLRQVVVLMIVPYDPFGKDRILYTVRRHCVEEPDMEYDDGSSTLFFYTRGKKGELPEDARKLLRYMEESKIENADCGWLKEIHEMVEIVRHDEEVSLEYMKVYEREKMILERGERIGEERGEKRGEKRGEVRGHVKLLRNMKKTMDTEQVSAVTCLEPAYVGRIFDLLETYPKENDTEIASRLLLVESAAEESKAGEDGKTGEDGKAGEDSRTGEHRIHRE